MIDIILGLYGVGAVCFFIGYMMWWSVEKDAKFEPKYVITIPLFWLPITIIWIIKNLIAGIKDIIKWSITP